MRSFVPARIVVLAILLVSSTRAAEETRTPARRTMAVSGRFLHLPVKNDGPMRRMTLSVDGRPVRAFDIELAEGPADFWVFCDLDAFRGKDLSVEVDATKTGPEALAPLAFRDVLPDADQLYREPLRPRFHFSSRRGWLNDPNGLVFADGEYHLFYQHNPYGWKWGNMHWGHAVSRDLVHWRELPDALYPWTQAKAHCFSGSAVVDHANTLGLPSGAHKTLVAAFTDTGAGECLAVSRDCGRTFTYFDGNPVVRHRGRDPKVFWYAPGNHWVMAVYDETDGARRIVIHTSSDLKTWTAQSHLDDYFECPELFELPVEGSADETRWVVWAADARYAVGRFDGRTFTPEHEGKHQVHWGDYYASQTYNDAPDGRRIQIGWARIEMPGKPFNQMMGFPTELTLHETPQGLRLRVQPVREIEKLYTQHHRREGQAIEPDAPLVVPVGSNLLDITAEFEPGDAREFGLEIAGTRVSYVTAAGRLVDMPLAPKDGRVRVRLLVDRSSLEICGNDGVVFRTQPFRHKAKVETVRVFSVGGPARLVKLDIHELTSIWEED
ncbi:MAG: glycoside hydrolase family 32 protein [Pirellulales bacterium]|nr:glycoside hydrolase family 32 protein [Pirellulales bacterium]